MKMKKIGRGEGVGRVSGALLPTLGSANETVHVYSFISAA